MDSGVWRAVAQPAPAPAPVAPVQPQVAPVQQAAPVQQMPVQQVPVQQAPVQPQMGGRPQANVAPQAAEDKAQKSAKPWFMFGKDGQ